MRKDGGGGLAGGTPLSLPLSPTERTWRGVQIPLPEGINFVREVVTNHAVSRLCGREDAHQGLPPQPAAPQCCLPPKPLLHKLLLPIFFFLK